MLPRPIHYNRSVEHPGTIDEVHIYILLYFKQEKANQRAGFATLLKPRR
jgi:hypothetical protein